MQQKTELTVIVKDGKKLFTTDYEGQQYFFNALKASAWEYISFKDNTFREKVVLFRNDEIFDRADIYCLWEEPMSFSGFARIRGDRECFTALDPDDFLEGDILKCRDCRFRPMATFARLLEELSKE